MTDNRPHVAKYMLNLAETVKERADCTRRQVGAVLWDLESKIVVSTGYNGVRAGVPGCLAGACPRGLLSYDEVQGYSDYSNPESPGYCISNHAEVNCVLHAERSVKGLCMTITDKPCPACMKFLYNAGLHSVAWPDGFKDFIDWLGQPVVFDLSGKPVV